MLGFKSGNNHLHHAVIDNDLGQALASRELAGQANAWGYTPIEIAKLLGRELILEKLEALPPLRQIEGFRYWPYPFFSSWFSLVSTLRSCPWGRLENFPSKELRESYLEAFWSGRHPDVKVAWVSASIGYGLFANADLNEGEFVGVYSGEVRRLYRAFPDQNDYCLHYPTHFWSIQPRVIDAVDQGSLTRFINHSDRPNLDLEVIVDRGLLHFILIAKRKIPKGSQLSFYYGEQFWEHREKKIAL